ncbi:MAG TPA: transcription elongation factor GreA [Candidatus Acidoferrales bacterium]|nr:transcription elongation factor GreA [Candidatus Acidoferrales bacterium]
MATAHFVGQILLDRKPVFAAPAQILYNLRESQSGGHLRYLIAESDVLMTDLAEKIKKKLKDEIAALEHELHDELPKEIKVARAHGDLSENAEYKYAKERQGYVAARLGQLHKRMADLSMLNLNNLPKDRAAYGSRIIVLDVAKSAKVAYKLVTVEEADVSKGLISTTSPIGKALLGKKVGDEVTVTTPAGVKEYEVVELATIYDED